VCYQLLLSNGKSEEAGRVMIELLGTYTTENASQAREEAQRCIIASLAGTVQTLPRSVGYAAVLEIRDILVPYLWLMDPDPTPDPTPFFSDFWDAKKIIFPHIFYL
jgi:hypothetical protein